MAWSACPEDPSIQNQSCTLLPEKEQPGTHKIYVWVAQFEKGPEASYLLEVKLYVEFLVSLFSNLSGLQARTAGANLFGVRHWIVEL